MTALTPELIERLKALLVAPVTKWHVREGETAWRETDNPYLVVYRTDLACLLAAVEEVAPIKAFMLDKTPAEFPGMLEVGRELIRLKAERDAFQAELRAAREEVAGNLN